MVSSELFMTAMTSYLLIISELNLDLTATHVSSSNSSGRGIFRLDSNTI